MKEFILLVFPILFLVKPSRYLFLALGAVRLALLGPSIPGLIAATFSLVAFLVYDYLRLSKAFISTLAIALAALAIGFAITREYRPFLIVVPIVFYIPTTRIDEALVSTTIMLLSLISALLVALFEPDKAVTYMSGVLSYLLSILIKGLRENF